ncbi:hypothetical protein AAG570_002094, partial [Ranatra chinensis]
FKNYFTPFYFYRTFLRELEQCGLDPVKVARVFVKNNSGFSIYTEYCTSYPRTVGVLTELMRKESTARLFRERQAALQHTLPLGSYLLKPVQRILKYHLLLQNIVKNLQPDAEGYGSVVDALSTMTGIAHHINEMKRKHEHAVRVQEIQSLLLGWHGEDLTTFGELCAEGTFRMAGAKALRHAFLFDQILLITKKKEEGILGYKAHIMCSNLMLIESVPGEPLSFHVIPFDNPRHQYTLQARSLEQKREWTLQLKRVILENYNAVIPSHARQLVMQLGQNRSDDEIMAERATPKKQHSAPEYLERRKQERERRKSETGIRARLRTRSRKQSDAGIPIKNQQRIRRNSQYRLEDGAMLPAESSMDSESSIATPADDLARPGVKTQGESPFSERGGVTTQEEEEEGEERGADKKRTLEEIVSQLLMQNKEFQRVLKKQRHGLGGTRRHHRAETTTSEDEPEESRGAASPGAGFGLSRSLSLNQPRVSPDYDNLQDIWIGGGLKRAQSFGSHQAGGVYSSSETASLAGSRTSFGASGGPTSPAVWLKQQHQHLPTPTQHKAGSLPRGFQLGNTAPPPQPWISPDRPFTIASDKPQDLNNLDMEDYAHQQQKRTSGADTSGGFPPVVDDTTEEESAGGTPDASTHHLDDLHPEYRIYRTSITTRQTLRQVLSSVSSKLASLRLSSETLDQMDVEQRASRLVNAFARTFRGSKRFDDSDLPVYKQGSSGLGARIAHGTEISDYADPRTLFPSITPSKKAASLLGIRPYSVLSLVSNLTSSSSSGYAGSSGSQSSGPVPQEPPQEMREGVDSDGSADSYYERTFEAMESSMSDTRCRDSAIFSDPEDILSPPPPPVRKVPPPIPRKPNNLKPPAIRPPPATPNSITPTTPDRLDDECDSTSSVASTVIENTTTTKGWVKHVICKIQGGTD